MGHYKANVRDLEFNLFEVFGRQEILGKGIYADLDVEAAKDILGEVARLAAVSYTHLTLPTSDLV